MADLSVADIVTFTAALVDERGIKLSAASPEDANATVQAFVDQINNTLGLLGGRQRAADDAIVLLPYNMPAYEVLSSSVPSAQAEQS